MIYTTKKIEEIRKKYFEGSGGRYNLSKVFHRGDWNMRKDGIEFSLTEEELREYAKSYNDIVYFAENHLKVTSPEVDSSGQDVKLKLRGYQKEILRNSQDHRFLIFSNPRQSGTSLLMDILILHSMVFGGKRNILGTSHNMACSMDRLENLKWLYRNVPYYMKPGIVKSNAWGFELENGAHYKIASQSSNLKGNSVDDLYLNDFGYYKEDNATNLTKTLFPVIAKGGKVILTSTYEEREYPNEVFNKMMKDSLRKPGDPKKNLFTYFKVWPWEAGISEDVTWRRPV